VISGRLQVGQEPSAEDGAIGAAVNEEAFELHPPICPLDAGVNNRASHAVIAQEPLANDSHRSAALPKGERTG
jgi:hypothetical protein